VRRVKHRVCRNDRRDEARPMRFELRRERVGDAGDTPHACGVDHASRPPWRAGAGETLVGFAARSCALLGCDTLRRMMQGVAESSEQRASTDEPDEPSTLPLDPPASWHGSALLTVLSGDSRGTVARLPADEGGTLSVGSAGDNGFVLRDAAISRHHLLFERTREGLHVRDLGSTNGVRVGGARVDEAIVRPGTVVGVGKIELLVGSDPGHEELAPSTTNRFGLVAGTTPAMRRIFGLLERIAPTSATVLLTGETGTGKDGLARSIHAASARRDGPFEIVDCGAIHESLITSELFGHERGAFTGAVSSRAGAFERAAGGTIFLDEIGELPMDLQPKLLRVLEAREFRRVGGTKAIPADVRIVAATTRDLAADVADGRFRQDLYFRLAVVAVHVPPLCQRLEDIPLLVERLLGANGLGVPPEVLAALKAYDWPGNVRELRNVLERSAHLSLASGAAVLQLSDFPPVRRRSSGAVRMTYEPGTSYRDARARAEAEFELSYVQWLLGRHGGNVSAAAREARMDRNYLTELARRHRVDRRTK
jgi:DNA-binding NtrC family response regulator